MQYDQRIIDLFQDFCAHHEAVYNFSPLTAQIYTYIMFNNNREGVTFDELIDRLHASKSSVSTSLNLLISNHQIEYFTKIEERKRFFRLNSQHITNRLELIRTILVKEHNLITQLKDLVGEGVIKTNNCQVKMSLYVDHLEKSEQHLSNTINKLNSTN